MERSRSRAQRRIGERVLGSGVPSVGFGLMGGAAALIGAAPVLVAGAAICAAINVGILAGRRDLRQRDVTAVAEEAPAR